MFRRHQFVQSSSRQKPDQNSTLTKAQGVSPMFHAQSATTPQGDSPVPI